MYLLFVKQKGVCVNNQCVIYGLEYCCDNNTLAKSLFHGAERRNFNNFINFYTFQLLTRC
jgi:hypothetical protein